jgi:hypothetical protein
MPYRAGGSKTSLLLRWTQITDNGGCPITGYRLFRDDGSSGSISIEVDPSDINEKPTLTQYNIDSFSEEDTGKQFRFQLTAVNPEGSNISKIAAFIIAQEPDKPLQAPTHDYTTADEQSLSLSLSPFTSDMDGGSTVIGY